MPRREGDDLRAADYVLGLMEPKEVVLFERDMRLDPALADRVTLWRSRVAGMDETEPTAQAQMRRRIIDGMAKDAAAPATAKVSRSGLPRRVVAALTGAALGVTVYALWRLVAG